MTEALREVEKFSGQVRDIPVEPVLDAKGKDYGLVLPPWGGGLEEAKGQMGAEIARLGTPTNNWFYYPFEKRRTRESHESMRLAESRLDAFWKLVDENNEVGRQWLIEHRKECDKCCDCGINTAVRRLLVSPRYTERTGPWIEPGKDKPAKEDASTRRPLSELYFDLERRTERTLAKTTDHKHSHTHHHHGHGDSHSHQVKTKTRGTPGPQAMENMHPAALTPSAEQDEQPIFAVDARTFRVFRTLFFTPSISSTPGEVPWHDFVHAMTSTGFEAEKLYDSVWNFRPTNLDVERSIRFHEPHPSVKIPYRRCRNHARRLNKAYGWSGENFVLAEKEGGPLREVQAD